MNLPVIITDKRIRNPLIAAVLAIVLAITLYIQFFSQPPREEGALRYVECKNCEQRSVKKIKDIGDPKEKAAHCEKCDNQLGYMFKCEECDREFSVLPEYRTKPEDLKKLRTMGKFKFAVEMNKCPNCGSVRTHPMSAP